MSEVEKWFSLLLPLLNKMLYKNGGPVIMVQVENEYGSYYACDFAYMTRLRDLHYHYFGNDVVLFTTDGNDDYFLKCGKIDGIFATIDFGSDEDPVKSFNYQRIHQEFGPNVNSEYYTGWIDHWDWPHSTATTQAVCNTLDIMLSINASVNLLIVFVFQSIGFLLSIQKLCLIGIHSMAELHLGSTLALI
jgi:beta-galactosidase